MDVDGCIDKHSQLYHWGSKSRTDNTSQSCTLCKSLYFQCPIHQIEAGINISSCSIWECLYFKLQILWIGLILWKSLQYYCLMTETLCSIWSCFVLTQNSTINAMNCKFANNNASTSGGAICAYVRTCDQFKCFEDTLYTTCWNLGCFYVNFVDCEWQEHYFCFWNRIPFQGHCAIWNRCICTLICINKPLSIIVWQNYSFVFVWEV